MKKFGIAAALMLVSVGAAMADQYDAVYVSDPAVCERAGEADMGQVLFDLKAAAVSPRVGIWMGELGCKLVDVHMNESNWGGTQEVYAAARCDGPYLAFIDTVVVTSDSGNINLAWGDREGTPPAMVEVLSMKHGDSTDAERDPESYAGVYTQCDALKPADFIK
ncbi:hypothetical protein ABIB57_001174 [Devosia sp. UYZn731]|uniref:hypothetical protein n=1 Tax=Devosia sp. UYZn731 TaxID=3156345 RepID=UPI003391D897